MSRRPSSETASARPDGVGARLVRRFAERTIRRSLRDGLRRVVAAGDAADPAPGRPLVLVANHHVYPDSFVLWHLITRVWGRPMVVWMEAWDRAPLFGPVGALPFPDGDARRRVRTVRETARRMAADPATALYLYPEGAMRVPEDGLGEFKADLPRLARLLPETVAWVPVGVRTSWWGEARPTAVVAVGPAADSPDGARAALDAALDRARAARPGHLADGRARVLFEGARGDDERWDLSRLAPLFERWTFGP